jgi:hypothetical protein
MGREILLDRELCEREILEYFSRVPYRVEFDEGGKRRIVAEDVPLLEGFCAMHDIGMGELEGVVSADVFERCRVKMVNVMVQNGLHGNYESGPWSLTMKNLLRWSERVESKVEVIERELSGEEIERGLRFLMERRMRGIEVSVADRVES